MGDVGDVFNALKAAKKAIRGKYAVACPECQAKLPKASPSMLLPQQICKIHKYRDPRKLGPEQIGRAHV